MRKTTQEFMLELENLYPNKYTVIGEYINAKTKIKVKHNECGNIWEITPSNILHGYSCPICNGGSQRNTESFKKIIEKLYGDEYTILGEYKKARQKILVRHNKCGLEWEITPDNLKRGKGCPHCNVHKTKEIYELEKFVMNLQVPYTLEKIFPDLKDIKHLRFDICIYSLDRKDFILVEYDPEHHRKNKEVIRRDNIKNQYCINNNYKLYRFDENNIDMARQTILDFLGMI